MPYNDFTTWIQGLMGQRVQRLPVDAGFTCPNRDGTIGTGGCTFCNNRAFTPAYCNSAKSVTAQLEEGKQFFSHKYKGCKYLAYFQSFTNTHASLSRLKEIYEEALTVKDIAGIVVGTRPDCISDALLDYLKELSYRTFLMVEYGIETTNDHTLERINRGHDFECTCHAIAQTHARGITTGGHIILGLPGESAEESLKQAHAIARLQLDVLKIHQLQIIQGTPLAEHYNRQPFKLYTPDEYLQLVAQYIRLLPRQMVLDRFVSQTPRRLLLAPHWGLKNHEFTQMLINYMTANGYRQGDLFRPE